MENRHEGTICLCMIIRDEEDTLGRCLESARGFVDEIVIVDTGSRDDTPAIAARYGARILHLPWRDDFSQARNEGLKQAIGEWVLVLDADEELPPETAGSLRGLAYCSEAEAWTFTIISPCSSDRAGQRIKHPGLRMFKNRDAYFFEGRIHEQIRPSILRANPDAAIMHANAEIIHNGYSMGIELRKSKTLRNISILEQALAEKPDDPFPNYNLGLSYYALGELEKSSRYYETARRLIDPSDGFAAALFRNYSICLGDLGNYEQALDLADEGLAYFPDYPDLYFIKGQLYCDLNMNDKAKANFLKCLRFKQTLPEYVTTVGVTGHLAQNNLAEVCTRDKRFDEAAAYLEQVLRIRPVYELFAQLCSLFQQKGLDGSEVAASLESGFQLGPSAIARLLFDTKEFQACLDYLDRRGASDPAGEKQPGGAHSCYSDPPGACQPNFDNDLAGDGVPARSGDASGNCYAACHDDSHRCGLSCSDRSWPETEQLLKARCLLHLGRQVEAADLLGRRSSTGQTQSPGAAELFEQHCLALWLQNPRQDAGAAIAIFGHPDDPSVIACRAIDSLLFNSGTDAPGSDSPNCKEQPGAVGLSQAAVERALHLALEALLAGDEDLALAASLAGSMPGVYMETAPASADTRWVRKASSPEGVVKARQALGNCALRAGCYREALQQLEKTLNSSDAGACTCYLLGKACAGLGRSDEAFTHFAQAGMQEPGNELYAACALEQLADQCLQHLIRMLELDDGNLELRRELFRVTSMRRKAQRLQQDLLRRGYGGDSAAIRKYVVETEAASECGDDSAATAENRGNSEAAAECRDGSAATEPAVPENRTDSKPGTQTELLSIVMPVWAGAEVTNKALQAIVACTDTPYEIIIIDNGGDNQCKAAIAAFESRHRKIARVIHNESNRGYPIACNQGLVVSRGRYAVVMNNDVLVTPHWDSLMMAAFSGDPLTGIVGPRTNYVSGAQLVRECRYDESTLNEWSQQWHGRHAGSRQSTLRLVGFLMMIRRELIEQIGGFDPIFGLGNFDDDDYCLRARLAGYRLVIAEDVFVHHYGSISFNKQPEAFSRLLEKNKQLFFAKWSLKAGYEDLFFSASSDTDIGHARRVFQENGKPAPVPDDTCEQAVFGAPGKRDLYIPLC